MKRIAPLAILCVILVGCTPTPNRAQVVESFEIELIAAMPVGIDLGTLPEDMADDAFSGLCGSDAYRTALDDPGLIQARDATCLMYFELDMTDAQQDRAREAILDSALERLED